MLHMPPEGFLPPLEPQVGLSCSLFHKSLKQSSTSEPRIQWAIGVCDIRLFSDLSVSRGIKRICSWESLIPHHSKERELRTPELAPCNVQDKGAPRASPESFLLPFESPSPRPSPPFQQRLHKCGRTRSPLGEEAAGTWAAVCHTDTCSAGRAGRKTWCLGSCLHAAWLLPCYRSSFSLEVGWYSWKRGNA